MKLAVKWYLFLRRVLSCVVPEVQGALKGCAMFHVRCFDGTVKYGGSAPLLLLAVVKVFEPATVMMVRIYPHKGDTLQARAMTASGAGLSMFLEETSSSSTL